MSDLKEDLSEVNQALQELTKAAAAEAAAETDMDQKLNAAAAAGKAIDPTSPQAQQQLKAAEDADKVAIAAWETLQAGKRATRKAQERAAKALAELYRDTFSIGPL